MTTLPPVSECPAAFLVGRVREYGLLGMRWARDEFIGGALTDDALTTAIQEAVPDLQGTTQYEVGTQPVREDAWRPQVAAADAMALATEARVVGLSLRMALDQGHRGHAALAEAQVGAVVRHAMLQRSAGIGLPDIVTMWGSFASPAESLPLARRLLAYAADAARTGRATGFTAEDRFVLGLAVLAAEQDSTVGVADALVAADGLVDDLFVSGATEELHASAGRVAAEDGGARVAPTEGPPQPDGPVPQNPPVA